MPPKKEARGSRPRRAATGSPAVQNPSSTPITSTDEAHTKTTPALPPQAAHLPVSSLPTGTETVSDMPLVTISQETVNQSIVREKRQDCLIETHNEKINAGKETLARESEAPEVALGIGSETEEKLSIGGTENANGNSVNENVEDIRPKKKTKKVVRVVKKLVKKRVPKSLHTGVAACSNKGSAPEEILDDGGERISSGERVSLSMQKVAVSNLSKRSEAKELEKQAEMLNGDREPTSCVPEQEIRKDDSLVSEKTDVGANLSVQETASPDELVGQHQMMDTTDGGVENLDAADNGKGASLNEIPVDGAVENFASTDDGKEASLSEMPMDGEENDGIVQKSDSATEVTTEMVNAYSVEYINSDRGAQVAGSSSGFDEGMKEESEISNGQIALSGELEALERRRRRRTEVFIGGLSTEAKEEDVRKVFEGAGQIAELRLVINAKTGKNRGYAFVRYALAIDAKNALEKYSKVEICGKQCSTAPVEGNDTIFLGNIDKSWKNEDVIKLLQDIGIEKIDKVTVMTDPSHVGRNRGFAFLELESYKDAQTAFKKLQKKDLGKLQNIKAAWAEPLSEPDEEELLKVKSVYTEYLPPSWDEEKIRSYFIKFGEIENVVLSRNLRSTKRKDFAFINFSNREAALTCIESFNHEKLHDEGSQVNLKVSLAKPIPKGNPCNKVFKSASKEISKQKQAAQYHVKPINPRNKETPVIHLSNQRKEDIKSPGTADLEQLLAERALRKQMQARLGMANQDYPQALPGHKRSFSALGDDLNYSDLRGYSRLRLENSFPIGRPSHGEVHLGVGVTSPYYQHQDADYALDPRYTNYASNFQREEAPYHGTGRNYYRY